MNAPVTHPPQIDAEGVTPVMAQFLTAKASQPDAIVFFRMGDFYELFFEDAEKASAVLGITLTKRGKHQGSDIPMAGVPVHAMDGYLARLIRAGFKVAVCEQMEDPSEARKRGSTHRPVSGKHPSPLAGVAGRPPGYFARNCSLPSRPSSTWYCGSTISGWYSKRARSKY